MPKRAFGFRPGGKNMMVRIVRAAVRLCAASTKILSVMVSVEELYLDENDELDESSEEVQADLQALECRSVCISMTWNWMHRYFQ